MNNRICETCRYYDPDGNFWQDICLQCGSSMILDYIRDVVLPENKCDKYKEVNNE